jgi:hypothetical protein
MTLQWCKETEKWVRFFRLNAQIWRATEWIPFHFILLLCLGPFNDALIVQELRFRLEESKKQLTDTEKCKKKLGKNMISKFDCLQRIAASCHLQYNSTLCFSWIASFPNPQKDWLCILSFRLLSSETLWCCNRIIFSSQSHFKILTMGSEGALGDHSSTFPNAKQNCFS